MVMVAAEVMVGRREGGGHGGVMGVVLVGRREVRGFEGRRGTGEAPGAGAGDGGGSVQPARPVRVREVLVPKSRLVVVGF